MKPDQAQIIARLAHKGQKYGPADYFQFHVENVVRRCEQNMHCTFGLVTLAYLHDVLEDTDLTSDELMTLGLSESSIITLHALTKVKGEDYASYITRVLTRPGAVFVKYHDLMENLSQCCSIIRGYGDPIARARAKSLSRRYTAALERIRAEQPYFLYEV